MKAAFLILLPIFAWVSDAGAQQEDVSWLEKLYRNARLRYNRVEGSYLGYRLSLNHKDQPRLTVFAESGYGFANRSPRWEAGLDYRGPGTSLTFAVFDRTESHDRDIVGTTENSLFSALFKWDHRDYFRAKNGIETKVSFRPRPTLFLLGGLTAFRCEPMQVRTDWSLFFGADPFESTHPHVPATSACCTRVLRSTHASGALFSEMLGTAESSSNAAFGISPSTDSPWTQDVFRRSDSAGKP